MYLSKLLYTRGVQCIKSLWLKKYNKDVLTLPDEQCWLSELDGVEEKEVKKIINSLGNLVPLSSAKNSKLQNYCFDVKKNGKNGEFTGYKNGFYSEQEINEEVAWGINEIKLRSGKLIDFLIEHWEIREDLLVDDIRNKLMFTKDYE